MNYFYLSKIYYFFSKTLKVTPHFSKKKEKKEK